MKVWVGLLAAPAAWWTEHLMGWGASEARCNPARVGVPFTTWVAIVTTLSAAIAAGGLVSAVLAFRAIKDDAEQDSDPPSGRIWLMSICGIVISPILLTIILLSGVGALLLGHCHQG